MNKFLKEFKDRGFYYQCTDEIQLSELLEWRLVPVLFSPSWNKASIPMELLKIDNKVPVIDLIDICLNKGLADGFDHQFRYVGQWWKFGDCDHNIADVLGLEDL